MPHPRTAVSHVLILCLLLAVGGCATYGKVFWPANCGFANWDLSSNMDSFVGDNSKSLVDQWGPPNGVAPDGQGGRFFLYQKRRFLREEFDINAQGKIVSWLWQSKEAQDNMIGFVNLVENLAYANDCDGNPLVPPETVQAGEALAAQYGIAMGIGPHFEPAYLNTLGNWYFYGNHVSQDYKKAFELYGIAASLNNPSAEKNLGDCYGYAQGVSKDPDQARYWYQLSVKQGEPTAVQALLRFNATNPPAGE